MKTPQAFLLIFFLSISCNVVNAAGPLKLNLQKGKIYRLRSTTYQTIQQSVNGQQMTTETNGVLTLSFKLLTEEKDFLRLEVGFDSIENKVSSIQGKNQDSFNKPAKSNEYMGRIKNRFVTYKVIAKISNVGKFIGFENYQAFKDSVLVPLDSVPATQKDRVKGQAEFLLKEASVQSMIEPFFVHLTDKPVKKGDQWDIAYTTQLQQFTFLISNTYTLNEVEGNVAKIAVKSEMESLPSNEPAQGGAQITSELKGNSTSDMAVDTGTGLVELSTTKGKIEGVMTVKRQDKEMKIDISADSNSSVVLVK